MKYINFNNGILILITAFNFNDKHNIFIAINYSYNYILVVVISCFALFVKLNFAVKSTKLRLPLPI